MCRAKDCGGRRCPADTGARAEIRRQRQRAAYAVKKAQGDERPEPQLVTVPPLASVSREDVAAAVRSARELLAQSRDTREQSGSVWLVTPGERLLSADDEGWDKPTEFGLRAEAAVRDAGRLLATRAEELAAPRLAEIDARYSDELLRGSAAEYSEHCAFMAEQAKGRYDSLQRKFQDGVKGGRYSTPDDLPDELKALRVEIDREWNTYIAHSNLAVRYGRDENPWSQERSAALADAYREVLAEQRPLGVPPEGLKVHPSSQKPAVRRLEEAVSIYPTEWLQTSNDPAGYSGANAAGFGYSVSGDEQQLKVRTTRGRAHYAHHATITTKGTEVREHEHLVPESEGLPPGAKPFSWADESNNLDDYERVFAVPMSGGRFMEVSPDSRWAHDAVWCRRVTAPKEVPVTRHQRVSELLVDTRKEGFQEAGISTALHEFGHRMEYLRPGITDLERTFLARRTTGPDGRRDRLRKYHGTQAGPLTALRWPRRGEYVREDHFVDEYVGKTYGPTQAAREVFTVGMEGVFSGRFGGLRGEAARYRADLEHRDLTLGILATC